MDYYSGAPTTPKELRNYIWHSCGGIKRDSTYWDSRCSHIENSMAYARMDRKWGKGKQVDVLADEIAEAWPWFGITDGNSLMEWLADNPRG